MGAFKYGHVVFVVSKVPWLPRSSLRLGKTPDVIRPNCSPAFLAVWVQSVFLELQRPPGTDLDQSRSTWVLMHGDLRRVQRVRLFVDFLYESLLERRTDFIGG